MSSPLTDKPTTMGESWALLRSRTGSKIVPQLLVLAFFVAVFVDERGEPGPVTPLGWAALGLGFAFYGIVLARLFRAIPRGRNIVVVVVDLYLLFLGYSLWLGWFPPDPEYRSVPAMVVWALVIIGTIAGFFV